MVRACAAELSADWPASMGATKCLSKYAPVPSKPGRQKLIMVWYLQAKRAAMQTGRFPI